MKRLCLLIVTLVLVAFLCVFVTSPVYAAIEWDSFSDEARMNGCEEFAAPNHTVYMQGIGFTPNTQYKVAYYEADTDGGGSGDTADCVEIDTPYTNKFGILESECVFTDSPSADDGTWHAVVYNYGDTPSGIYNPTGAVADDGYDVQPSAIPEFPTVIAMMVAMGLSLGIYFWMRKRYRRQLIVA